MSHLLYGGVLLGCLIATLPLELLLGARVYRRPVALAGAVLPVAVVFAIWDGVATHRHWWRFTARYVLPPRIAGLPVEELLFFVVVPICSVLTFEAVRRLRPDWFGTGRPVDG
ncbi:MAG: lycopene cyclase domain-containing protein [Jatrophihabitans sp.]